MFLRNIISGHYAARQRDYNKEDHGKDKRVPGNRYAANAKQKRDNGRECHKDNKVVCCNLYHRIGRVTICKMAPNKYHRGARGGAQQDCTGQIVFCKRRRNESLKDNEEKQPGDPEHGKGFYDPVGYPRDK
ncbi:hypothetical protein SDC9_152539 [bioreactor metagenome]|uniref:Uncharacterized protein n=1 Tax=bioreactor metagenome TaxID=1076179 RepID=A0A645EVQ2_9ZZZZ